MFVLMLLYLVMTIIRPQDYLPALMGVPVMPVLIVASLLAWLVSSRKNFQAPQYLLLALFVLVTVVSIAYNGWIGGAGQQLFAFAPTLVAFVVLANALDSKPRIHLTMMVMVLCAVVLAWHGIYQLQHDGIGWTGALLSENRRTQYIGIFHDPNDLSLLFVMVLPMACYLMARPGANLFGRLLWLISAVLLVYGVYLTKSRGAMLALATILGIYVWRKRGAVLAVVLGAAVLALMKVLSPRMQQLDVDESSAFGRVDAWYTGMHLFLSHPVFGVGTHNFTDYNALTAHNSFVLVLAETGFVGYVLWLAFVCYGLWMSLTVVRHQPDPQWLVADDKAAAEWRQERALAMTMLLAQAGFVAAAFFLSRSYVIILYLLEALVVGYYVSARKRVPGLPEFRLGKDLLRWPALALASIVVLFVMVRVLMMLA